jgi:type III secretion system YscQ/HrcQ family protein
MPDEISSNDTAANEKASEPSRSRSSRKKRPCGLDEEKPFIDTLATYDITEARAINRILAHNGGFEIQLQQGGFEFAFAFQQHACRANMLFTLCVGDIDFIIGLERCLFADLEGVDQLHDLPIEIRNLYFEVLFEDICERLETWTGQPVQIKNFGSEKQVNWTDLPRRLDFRMLRLTDSQHSAGFVMTSGNGLRVISELMAALPPAPAREYDDLALLIRVEIGKAQLKIENYKQIEPQDIILVNSIDPESGELPCHLLPAPGRYLEAKWNPNKNHIVITSEIKEGYMSNFNENQNIFDDKPEDSEDFSDENQNLEKFAALDELPVELTFDIGSIPITLGELKCVREGFIFETQRAEHDPVRIRVNGKLIGSGELVRLRGRMGVRILEMPPSTI